MIEQIRELVGFPEANPEDLIRVHSKGYVYGLPSILDEQVCSTNLEISLHFCLVQG